MIIQHEAIDRNVKYWVLPDIENRIKEGSIKALFNTKVKEIHPKSLLLENESGDFEIENDFVLAMTGYKPNYPLLKKFEIDLIDENQIPCFDQQNHETNRKGMYLAGVVCGGLNTRSYFIENSIEHSQKILNDIKEKIHLYK